MKSIRFLNLEGESHHAVMSCVNAIGASHHTYPEFKTQFPIINMFLAYGRAIYLAFAIPKYKVYFLSGSGGLFIAWVKKFIRREKCKVIVRVNDSLYSEDQHTIFKWIILRILHKAIDGCIAVSDMIKDDIQEVNPKMPVKVFYSPIRDNRFFKIKPDFKKRGVLCLGTAPRTRKGTDVQLIVYRFFRHFVANKVNFYILGPKEFVPKQVKEVETYDDFYDNIEFCGNTDPLIYMKKCLFLLHPARFDASPNAISECMAAGIIPLVSYKSGRKEMIEEVDESLVIHDLDYHYYYDRLRELYRMKPSQLKKLSNKCKKVARKYNKKYTMKYFNKLFVELL
jgi:glycosyltransferase involved in cell wall biosynthesis